MTMLKTHTLRAGLAFGSLLAITSGVAALRFAPGPPVYTIDEFTVLPSTTETMSAGGIEIVGTAGQPDASLMPLMGLGQGGELIEIEGGFWVVPFGQNTWDGRGNGSFDDPAQWLDGEVPTETDTVVFGPSNGDNYDVQFPNDATVARLMVVSDGDTSVDVDFFFSDSTLSLLGDNSGEPSLLMDSEDGQEVTLDLNGTGTLDAQSVSIGHTVNSRAIMNVFSQNMTLNTGDPTVIGRRGYGELILNIGAMADTVGDVIIGEQVTMVDGQDIRSEGRVSVENGSTWTTTGDRFIVGESGDGRLDVLSGSGLMTSSGEVTIASNAGSTGVARVKDMDSIWVETSATSINVGNGSGEEGDGVLIVRDGGTVVLTGGGVEVRPKGILEGDGMVIAQQVENLGLIRVGTPPDPGAAAGPVDYGTLMLETQLFRQNGSDDGDTSRAGEMILRVGTENGNTVNDSVMIMPLDGIGGIAQLGGGLILEAQDGFELPTEEQITLIQSNAPINAKFNVALKPEVSDPKKFVKINYVAGGGIAGGGESVVIEVGDIIEDILFGGTTPGSLDGVPNDLATADFDGDGDDDLAVLVPSGPDFGVYILLSDVVAGEWMGFTVTGESPYTADISDPTGITVGKLNDATPVDFIAVTNEFGDTVKVFSSDGDGTFTDDVIIPAVGTDPQDLTAFDLEGDGDLDIAVISGTDDDAPGELRIFENDAALVTGFNPGQIFNLGILPDDIENDDITGDKDIDDLVISNRGSNNAAIVYNNGDGTMDAPIFAVTGDAPGQVELRDLDLDGNRDIVIANTGDGTVTVILNDGSGTPTALTPAVNLPVGANLRSLVVADLEPDGDADIVVIADDASQDPPVPALLVLRNDQNDTEPLGFSFDGVLGSVDNPILIDRGDLDGNDEDDVVALSGGGGGGIAGGGAGGAYTVLINDEGIDPCPWDLNGDGVVGPPDLAGLLDAWGPNPDHPADFNGDGVVGPPDLAQVLDNWGACPG